MILGRIKEWTLIEWMITLSIAGVILAITLGALGILKHENTQCIGGYLFTNPIQYDYKHPVTPVQVMDERGRGIPCTEK